MHDQHGGERLSIGRFARLSRLTVKRLRHYDELGLLSPVEVDPVTGYRFYTRAQVRDAMAIGLLRSLEVPLPRIAEILAGDEQVQASVLAAERARLEARLAWARRTMDLLARLLDDGLLRHEVRLAREPARRLLVARTVCTADEIGAAIGRCVRRVTATGPLWGLFPVDLDGDLSIGVGAELPDGSPGDAGLDVELLPATSAAVAVHVGPYEHLPLTYQSVFAWIYERGLRPRGTAQEQYLNSPTTTDPADLATRLVVPVEEE